MFPLPSLFDHLSLVLFFVLALEVMHFVRDAHLAEEWIFKEDLNVAGKDQGVSFICLITLVVILKR